jgi:hypothetical protein
MTGQNEALLSGVGFCFFGLDGVFNRHIVKFFRIKDFTALQAFNKFNVVVPGDNSHSRVFADGRHDDRGLSWSVLISIPASWVASLQARLKPAIM